MYLVDRYSPQLGESRELRGWTPWRTWGHRSMRTGVGGSGAPGYDEQERDPVLRGGIDRKGNCPQMQNRSGDDYQL